MALISLPPNAKPYSVSPQPHRLRRTTLRRRTNLAHSVIESNLVHTFTSSRTNHGKRPLPILTATPISASESFPESNFGTITLSDVVVKRRRSVYWGRNWNSRDIGTASVVVFMHLLCFLAPFTFNWGNPIDWVSTHRYHHQFCDSERDPHSPVEGF
ncbi:hypothetical protein CsSME_00052477 [Camellia sinensis var. sinensis]